MKALTLYQPWAALVAAGAKRIETRSWYTLYRGPLAIHAASSIPREYSGLWLREPFLSALAAAGVVRLGPGKVLGQGAISQQLLKEKLHLGCVVATCKLIGCVRISRIPVRLHFGKSTEPDGITSQAIPPFGNELAFGDYTPGRFAWVLSDIKPLEKPVKAKGHQRLWNWAGA